MTEISLADFQVLEVGSFTLDKNQSEKTIGFTIPADIALNQVVVLQSKITVKVDGSTFEVSVGQIPIWKMKANKSHTRGLWKTFIAKNAFGDQKAKTIGITFTVPSGSISFSDVVIWFQRTISLPA